MKYRRFEEFQVVLTKVPSGSVVRITVRAEAEFDLRSLNNRVDDTVLENVRNELQQSFEEQFARVLPHPAGEAFASESAFARTVQLMVKRAASAALDTPGSNRDFMHVHSVRYDDNTQMLSVTGIVHDRPDADATREVVSRIRFADPDWPVPYQINIPALSAKERHRLEHLLPVAAGEAAGPKLYAELGYHIDNGELATTRQLQQYAGYYREYPAFVRVSI